MRRDDFGATIDRRAFLRALGLSAAVVPLAAACGGPSIPKPSGGPTTPGAGSPSPGVGSPSPGGALAEAGKAGLQIGEELPELRSEAVEGPEIVLARYRGAPLLLNFWASNCVPCRREFPLLRGALERHSDLPILGVNVMDRRDDAKAFIEQQGATWPHIWDPDGSIAAKLRVRVLPVTYAVGRNFHLVDRLFGELDRNRLDSMVEAILRS